MSIKMISFDEVEEITLLTIEQAERLPKEMLPCRDDWWLRSPGTIQQKQPPKRLLKRWRRRTSDYTQDIAQDFAAYVDNDGTVRYGGTYVFGDYVGVRPAFVAPSLSSEIGAKVQVGGCPGTTIDKDLVLADSIICRHRFDSESNNWEASELKAFIESDEFKSLLITSKELEFMFDFIEKTDFGYDKSRKQLRSLWTAYCLHDEILKDSASWDINIRRLYTAICKNLSCPWHDDEEEGVLGIELFYSFMEEEL